jgi:hypothetical protein
LSQTPRASQLEAERARLELELERSARLAAERSAAELAERVQREREQEMEMVSVAGVRTDISPGRCAPARRPCLAAAAAAGALPAAAGGPRPAAPWPSPAVLLAEPDAQPAPARRSRGGSSQQGASSRERRDWRGAMDRESAGDQELRRLVDGYHPFSRPSTAW